MNTDVIILATGFALFILVDRFFPRISDRIDRVLYFILPLVALLGTIAAWGMGGYRVLWAVALGALAVLRFDDFMDWRYRGISPFRKGETNG